MMNYEHIKETLELKITRNYSKNPSSCTVSVKATTPTGYLLQAPSPSSFVGVGGCFGTALDDYIKKFNAYLEVLVAFKNQVMYTSRAYRETFSDDSLGITMERLTDTAWRNLDPWECCGQDYYCQMGCHDEGGCANGCIVPKTYFRLAVYEDTGLAPEEITALQEENARLRKQISS